MTATASPAGGEVEPPLEPPLAAGPRREAGVERMRARLTAVSAHPRHLALAGVLALSAVLNTHRLSQNGYANIFYSAGVKSMLRSLHNFVFVASDPGGLISIDKPPLALWVQAASAKLFGFSPLSLLLPEAIAGVLAVALLYRLLARRVGVLAGLAGALALAVFPSFVAVSRENGVDAVLILVMVLACGAGLRATETGRWRTLLWCGALVGLAFNTKTLAAYLVVPGIALAFLVCAPGSLARRATQLLAAGLAMAVVSFAWIAFVDLTPASERPYVGSSTNNSEIGLTFEYNGFGRVGGQAGGPGQVLSKPGARVPAPRHGPGAARGSSAKPAAKPAAAAAAASSGREKNPIPFGGSPSALRLFGTGLGDQGGWMIPFALFGLFGLALLLFADGRPERGDPRLAALLVLGGWFLVEAVVLSTSKGIVHPYYVSALAPGTGAMAGAGVEAFTRLARGSRRLWSVALVPCALAATVAVQVVLMHREHYMVWFEPALLIGAAVAACALIALRRLAAPSIVLAFLLLLVVPTAYASSTWLAPVQGTFPAAGPTHTAGAGGFGVGAGERAVYDALERYVTSHRPGSRWALFTVAASTAAPMTLKGLDAGSLGGYSGTDPALDGRGLARLVAAGRARYVLLGGEFSLRGGNGATQAVLRACLQLPPATWHSPVAYPSGLTLFDCAGRERALAG